MSAWRLWPRTSTRTGAPEHGGVRYAAVAKSVERFVSANDIIEIAGAGGA